MSHTPGPWKAVKSVQDQPPFEWVLMADGYGAVGYSFGHKDHHGDNYWRLNEADARLIAAAPELLDELEQFVAAVSMFIQANGGRAEFDQNIIHARKLIAKAKGEAS